MGVGGETSSLSRRDRVKTNDTHTPRHTQIFHKVIALTILLAALGHVIAHLGNWAVAADKTIMQFGKTRIYIIWSVPTRFPAFLLYYVTIYGLYL